MGKRNGCLRGASSRAGSRRLPVAVAKALGFRHENRAKHSAWASDGCGRRCGGSHPWEDKPKGSSAWKRSPRPRWCLTRQCDRRAVGLLSDTAKWQPAPWAKNHDHPPDRAPGRAAARPRPCRPPGQPHGPAIAPRPATTTAFADLLQPAQLAEAVCGRVARPGGHGEWSSHALDQGRAVAGLPFRRSRLPNLSHGPPRLTTRRCRPIRGQGPVVRRNRLLAG